MDRIRLKSVEHPMFPSFWDIYGSSFPLNERRGIDDQMKIFSDDTYFLEIWVDGQQVLGFIGWWDCGDLSFVEHYAIHSGSRSSGYGSAFLSEWMKGQSKSIILEIEPVVDEITLRRKNFYTRLGFVENDIEHTQPPFHKETGAVPMRIMSYPQSISKDTYVRYSKKQREEIMPQFN